MIKLAKKGKKGKSTKKPTLPLGLLIPGAIGTYATIKEAWAEYRGGTSFDGILRFAFMRMTGYDMKNGAWRLQDAWFTLGWVGGGIIHKAVGGYLGVNRALGAAHVPLIRV